MLSIKVGNDDLFAELLLQVGKAIIVAFSEGVRDGFHRISSIVRWSPVDGAEDTVYCNGLKSFEEAEGFEHGAAHGKVVERDLNSVSRSQARRVGMCKTNLLYDAFAIQNEHASQTHPFFFNKHAVVSAHSVTSITQEADVDLSQPAILPRDVLPVPKRVFGVDTDE